MNGNNQKWLKNFQFKISVHTFFLGDVRDKDRLLRAFKDIGVVVHAATLNKFQLRI